MFVLEIALKFFKIYLEDTATEITCRQRSLEILTQYWYITVIDCGEEL